jgi:phosphoribosylglycinamide formyltransferase 1
MSNLPEKESRRIGILISGRGSNMVALIDAIDSGRLNAKIAVVISNRADAAGIEIAKSRGLETVVIAHRGLTREAHEELIIKELNQREVVLVCLAGYMRILSTYFLKNFSGLVLNIHPSLLPAFPGLDAQKQALEYGVKFSGCTVHIVDEGCDQGPIILQSIVPVLDEDTAETLSERILVQEHRIYSQAVEIVLGRDWKLDGRRVIKVIKDR